MSDDQIFYVGVGSDGEKLERAYNSKQGRNRIWINYTNKYDWYVEIFQEDLTKEESFETEISLIKRFGKICNNTGTLCNISDGGEYGINKIERTKEHCENISKALTGMIISDEAKLKMRNAKLGKKHTKEHIENMSKAQRGKIVSEETRYLISIAHIGKKKPQTQETIDKIKNIIKEKYKDGLPHCKRVIDNNTGKEYQSISEAAWLLMLRKGDISDCCKGTKKPTEKYNFRYA